MKYLIILLICGGLISCSNNEIHVSDKNRIIKQELTPSKYITTGHKGKYMYTILEDIHNGELLIFTDSVYTVGDTIKFTK